MSKPIPMVCLVCKHNGQYYGRLVFPVELQDGQQPTCPNHKGKELDYPLTAVTTKNAR